MLTKVSFAALILLIVVLAGLVLWQSSAENQSSQQPEPQIEIGRFHCAVTLNEGVPLMSVHIRHLDNEVVEDMQMGASFWTTGNERIGFKAARIERARADSTSGWFSIYGPRHPMFERCTIEWFETQDGQRLTWRSFDGSLD